jgi:hypothetical protein
MGVYTCLPCLGTRRILGIRSANSWRRRCARSDFREFHRPKAVMVYVPSSEACVARQKYLLQNVPSVVSCLLGKLRLMRLALFLFPGSLPPFAVSLIGAAAAAGCASLVVAGLQTGSFLFFLCDLHALCVSVSLWPQR